MRDEFLAKLQGSSRTFVIQSNTNPQAAAAMAGMMAARIQEAGPYFRLSDHLVPMVDGREAEDINTESAPNQLDTDFKDDWVAYLRTRGLPMCGLRYEDCHTPEESTIRFLNAYQRIPAMKARSVHESRELWIPPEYQRDYEELKDILKAGGDLRPYLSRDIKKRKPDKNDKLLNSWGINHLHFRPDGTAHILFCLITESDVFMIQTLHHEWVNTQLIQILHDNWPKLIIRAKHSGLRPEQIPAAKHSALRGYNANFPITVADDTVYLPPAGGTMVSGDSLYNRVICDNIFRELENWQSAISQHAPAIRTALNWPASKTLLVRMAFDNHDCCFYEPTRPIRLKLPPRSEVNTDSIR